MCFLIWYVHQTKYNLRVLMEFTDEFCWMYHSRLTNDLNTRSSLSSSLEMLNIVWNNKLRMLISGAVRKYWIMRQYILTLCLNREQSSTKKPFKSEILTLLLWGMQNFVRFRWIFLFPYFHYQSLTSTTRLTKMLSRTSRCEVDY